MLETINGIVPKPVNVDAAWLSGKTAPYQLNTANTQYILQQDISVDGSAFNVTANNVVVDLNNFKITYNKIGGGVPNASFEFAAVGDPSKPDKWNLSAAPGAVRTSTYEQPMVDSWYLKISDVGANQTIVSDWANLPLNTACRGHFVRADAFWKYRIVLKFEIEHDVLGIVAAFYSTSAEAINFKTSTLPGRYRIHLTLVDEVFNAWQPSTEYQLGDVVIPTIPNAAAYTLLSVGSVIGGASGPIQPAWNTTLGGLTVDNLVTWQTVAVGTTDAPSLWTANKAYVIANTVRSTNTPGVIYEAVKIKQATPVLSGTTEPNWTPLTGNVNTPDGLLSWKILPPTDVHVDLVDIVPVGISAITAGYRNGLIIKDGRIEQGAGAGFRCHGIDAINQTNMTTKNLNVSTNGLESSAFQIRYSNTIAIHGNNVKTTGAYKFDRHQLSAAVGVYNTTDSNIYNNTVFSGRGWGGIFVGGNIGVVTENYVFTESVITNHYGIMGYGNNYILENNNVICDPGQGMRVDGNNNTIENNDITIRSVAPNWDIGRFSLDGIRVNDYWNGTAFNNTVNNNRITLYGKNSPLYRKDPQVLNGICNVSNGDNNVYVDNTISCIKIDPEIKVMAIMPGSKDKLVKWINTSIISDQTGIMFGAYPTYSLNSLFIDTKFIEGQNAGPDYALLAYEPKVSTLAVNNTIFINTSILGRGSLRSILAAWYPPTYHSVKAKVEFLVVGAAGLPVAGATVQVSNATGVLGSVVTDAQGVATIECPVYNVRYQLVVPKYTVEELNPYSAVVSKDAATKSLTFSLSENNKTLVVTL